MTGKTECDVDLSLVDNVSLANELMSRFDACVVIVQHPADKVGSDTATTMVHTGHISSALGMMERFRARLLRECAELDEDDWDEESEDEDGE